MATPGSQPPRAAPPVPARPGAAPTSAPAPVDPSEAPLEEAGFDGRYLTRTLLGAGGMGEVHLSRDARIGREVAVKVSRSALGSSGDAGARFAREARVQGQLEHPAIVPVYDLGRRPDGSIYFTMKRVRGVTLEQIMERLRAGEPSPDISAASPTGAARNWSRRKLLTAFGQVCQAVHFAHTRGVLHRDLKPANIMLGDFGEVYVLDWGLAKLTECTDEAPPPGVLGEPGESPRVEVASSAGATTSGAVMGTPGYMPPEQIRGDVDALDARTDVYALGAMLFEILAFEPLVPRTTAAQMLADTLAGPDASAVRRVPERDIPPELDAACVRACAVDPAARFATARELHEAVERFLDGDRDLERRRALASEWGEAADTAATIALGPGAPAEERQRALSLAGRALALDPKSPAALGAMIRLLMAPPVEEPPDVKRDLEQASMRNLRLAARVGGYTYLSWLAFMPLMWLMGVKDWTLLGTWIGLLIATVAISLRGSTLERPDWRHFAAGFGVSTAAILSMAPIFGPFVVIPVLISVNTIAYAITALPAWRRLTIFTGALAVTLPVLWEQLGWGTATTTFHDGSLRISSAVVDFPPAMTLVVLSVSMVALVFIPALFVSRIRDGLAAAERALQLQSWHLRQLIPAQARDAIAPGLDESPGPLLSCPIDQHFHRRGH